MTSKPRILYVCPCWPLGRYGGQLRALHIGRALRHVGAVTVAVVSPELPDGDTVERCGSEFQLEPQVRVELRPNCTFLQKLRWALDPRYLNVHGCVANRQDRERLLSQLDRFDLVWVLNSRTPNILEQWSWPGAVLDVDDVPSTFQRSIWRNGDSWIERFQAAALMLIQQRRERLWAERFPILAVCSEPDRSYLGAGEHLHVIPNGFEAPGQPPPRHLIRPPRIGFVGLFSYTPNLEGVRWFTRRVWPLVKHAIPDARLRLMGKDSDLLPCPEASDIDRLGWVAEPAAEIATWSAMVIPLRQGAGTRVKLAEAFSRKCPVVSTRFGAFGYDVRHERELLLADEPVPFANACITLVKNPMLGAALAERAFAAFLAKWTWNAVEPNVWRAAEAALRQRRLAAENPALLEDRVTS